MRVDLLYWVSYTHTREDLLCGVVYNFFQGPARAKLFVVCVCVARIALIRLHCQTANIGYLPKANTRVLRGLASPG